MEEKKSLMQEFKEFIMKGNVMDLAIGVIIGGAFGTIVSSLVNDIVMPVISLITGGVDFNNWFVALDGQKYASLAAAQEAGAATLNYGVFITAILNFLIMAFVIFFIVKAINKARDAASKKEEEAAEEAPAGPTSEELLGQILEEIKAKKVE